MAAPEVIPPRRELKFVVDMETAARLREHLQRHCHLDIFSASAEGHRYGLTSLYFDTHNLDLYRQGVDGAQRRFKLRIRRYDRGPTIAEVKHRIGDIIVKRRRQLARRGERGPATMADLEALLDDAPERHRHNNETEDFVARTVALQAEPSLLVRYRREAWTADNEHYVRVTFDSKLRVAPPPADGGIDYGDDDTLWEYIDDDVAFAHRGPLVLVEVKVEDQVPRFLAAAIRDLGMQRVGFSKYATGIRHLRGEPLLSPRRRVGTFSGNDDDDA